MSGAAAAGSDLVVRLAGQQRRTFGSAFELARKIFEIGVQLFFQMPAR